MPNRATPDFRELIKSMLKEGLFLDPPLIGIEWERFSGEAFALLESSADDLQHRYVHLEEIRRYFPQELITSAITYGTIYEFLTSTSTYLAHTRMGNLVVDLEIAQEAVSRLDWFMQRHSYLKLFYLYYLISNYHNLQVVNFYKRVSVMDFIYGVLHRPWVSHTLEEELSYLISCNYLRLVHETSGSVLEITNQGQEAFLRLSQHLRFSGYLGKRIQLLSISHYDALDPMDRLHLQTLPTAVSDRQKLLDYAGIEQGMRVLEVGAGSGLLTIEAGLAQRVGDTGSITAIDASVLMVEALRKRISKASIQNVEVLQTDVHALPFNNDSFDAAIGFGFLQFTDFRVALQEMKRVTRPGGKIAIVGPVSSDLNVPFFSEWFEPMVPMVSYVKSVGGLTDVPKEMELEQYFLHSGLKFTKTVSVNSPWMFEVPEDVIHFMLQGVSYFREVLIELPWKARTDLLQTLTARGVEACKKYTSAERRLDLSGELVIGTVQKN